MEGWKKENLGNLLELVYGKSLPKKNRVDGNIPVYGSNGIVGFHDAAIVNEPGIIIGRKGSAGNVHISKVPFCPIDTTFYITQQHSKLDIEYLYYALNFLDLKRILGDVGVPGLNRDMAYLEELIYPSDKAEQRKIAHLLNTVQKAIEQQDKLISTTTKLKKALMQKLFTEGSRGEPQKETEIGLVPESWEVKKIGDFSKLYTGGTPNTKNENYYNPKEIPWMKSGEITGKRIKSVSNFISNEGMNSSNARLLPTDSVVIALNGRGKTRGTTSILDFECTCNQSVVCISPNSKDELNTEFLHNYLSYLYDFIRNLTGNNDRSGLSMAKIRQILLMVPEITEQIEIGNVFQCLDDKIEILENKKQTLNSTLSD